LEQSVLLSIPDEATFARYAVKDLSVFGAGICVRKVLVLPKEFELSFDNFKTSFACRLVWQRSDRAGVLFVY